VNKPSHVKTAMPKFHSLFFLRLHQWKKRTEVQKEKKRITLNRLKNSRKYKKEMHASLVPPTATSSVRPHVGLSRGQWTPQWRRGSIKRNDKSNVKRPEASRPHHCMLETLKRPPPGPLWTFCRSPKSHTFFKREQQKTKRLAHVVTWTRDMKMVYLASLLVRNIDYRCSSEEKKKKKKKTHSQVKTQEACFEPLKRSWLPPSEYPIITAEKQIYFLLKNPNHRSQKREPFSQEMHMKIPLLGLSLTISNFEPGCRISALHFFENYLPPNGFLTSSSFR
jgi:hypothetical protein